MPAPLEFPVLAGQVTAVADGDVIPLSATDVFAVYVETAEIILSDGGLVTVGGSATPTMPPRYFPPIASRIPDLRYPAYYNLKHMYAKMTKAGDSLVFEATLPLTQPPAS